jgi:GNAT superfamily N-acetyltransferase
MIEIVRAEEKHVPDIGKLWLEFLLFHADIDPIWTPVENPISGFIENHLRRFMESQERLVLVARGEQKTIGYALAEIRRITPGLKREKYGYIDQMAVTESHWREGAGKKMFNEIVNWFKSNEIKRVELGTTAENLVANSFWQKQGFQVYMHTLFKEV